MVRGIRSRTNAKLNVLLVVILTSIPCASCWYHSPASRMWRGRPESGSFSAITRGRGGARPKPDLSNRWYYFQSGSNRGGRGRGIQTTLLNSPSEVAIKEGLDTTKIIRTIPQPARLAQPKVVPIKNVNYLASYNWVDTEKPTIVVPGSPAVWTVRDVPFTLQPDPGSNFVNHNTAPLSDYPMLPLFTAADVIHDDKAPVDWPSVDVITDRNGLRKLLRWLSPSEGRKVREFRIDVELVGAKTIVLGRWDDWNHNPPSTWGFGYGFKEAMTSPYPGCPGSGHHRVVSYDMHDKKMIVRFGVDACSSTNGNTTTTNPRIFDTKHSEKSRSAQSVDDLADTLGSINLAGSTSTQTAAQSPEPIINIVRAGTQVPQDAMLELTARSALYVNRLDWNELYPQLVLSQTPTLHLGVHERGTFTELREWRVDGASADADAGAGAPAYLSAQRSMTAAQVVRLARVLGDVQELAISRGPGPAGSFSLVCENGELRVYGRKSAKSCLPPDVKDLLLGDIRLANAPSGPYGHLDLPYCVVFGHVPQRNGHIFSFSRWDVLGLVA